ncbi:MAG: hypothetical protein ACM3ZE_16605, partial [Myxococcales bacterium]
MRSPKQRIREPTGSLQKPPRIVPILCEPAMVGSFTNWVRRQGARGDRACLARSESIERRVPPYKTNQCSLRCTVALHQLQL